MSIEQHTPPEPPSAEAGEDLARLLDGLTRTVLGLPDEAPEAAPVAAEVAAPAEEPAVVPEPRAERRTGNVLNELSFLDD